MSSSSADKNRAISYAMEPVLHSRLEPPYSTEGVWMWDNEAGEWRPRDFDTDADAMLALIDAMRERGTHFTLTTGLDDRPRASFASDDSYGTAVAETIQRAVRDAAFMALGLEGDGR